jgi:hypothetical protein
MRAVSTAIVAVALLIVIAMPTLASANGPRVFLRGSVSQLILKVNIDTVQFEITSFTGVLLCSGVVAQLSNGGLVGRRGIDDELFPFSETQFRCSSRVDLPDEGPEIASSPAYQDCPLVFGNFSFLSSSGGRGAGLGFGLIFPYSISGKCAYSL